MDKSNQNSQQTTPTVASLLDEGKTDDAKRLLEALTTEAVSNPAPSLLDATRSYLDNTNIILDEQASTMESAVSALKDLKSNEVAIVDEIELNKVRTNLNS